MFKLHAVQAEFGDSLILEFGTAAKRRFALVDGGPPDSFANHLEAALRDVVGAGQKLDLAVLSHVDNDHVVGLLDMLAALEEDDASGRTRRVQISTLWHNSFRRTIDADGTITQRLQGLLSLAAAANTAMQLTEDAFLGIGEGHRLRTLALQLGIPINKGFHDDLILVETAKDPVTLGPLTLTVVGPTRANLDELKADWLEWLDKTEEDFARDPATAANADQSVPNLSSIVIHCECNGKTALLTGDARSDHIEQGLGKAKLLKNGKLHVDLLKVQHHGSNRNMTKGFFQRVTANTYVISANGRDDNPDLQTLEFIVETANAAGRQIEIVVTNTTKSTKALRRSHKPSQFGYTLTVKPTADHSIAVQLA